MIYINLKSKLAFFFGLALAVLIAGRCIWVWQPMRQVERHHAALLEAVADRDWDALNDLISPTFSHPSGHDKAWLLKESGEVRRHFFALTVEDVFSKIELTPSRDQASVEATIRLQGSGTAVAQYVIAEVNNSNAPFSFTWQKMSWKPWDWQLITADHPLIKKAPTSWGSLRPLRGVLCASAHGLPEGQPFGTIPVRERNGVLFSTLL